MNTDFKLEAETGNAPVVGDRYIKRDHVCEVISVSDANIVITLTTPATALTRFIPRGEFEELRARTMRSGAVFKPAAIRANPCPSVVKE